MRIEIETRTYNERRYGKPYICLLTNDGGERKAGRWIGSAGDAGMLVIEADAGDIICQGQYDNRSSRRDDEWYAVVKADGTWEQRQTLVEAIKDQRAQASAVRDNNPLASVSDDDLIAEMLRRGYNAAK